MSLNELLMIIPDNIHIELQYRDITLNESRKALYITVSDELLEAEVDSIEPSNNGIHIQLKNS